MPEDTGGVLGFFARHRTAANLVMIVMMLAGFIGLTKMNTQFFPDFGIDIVLTTVSWPGASATDVDNNIVQPIDREVRFLDNVKQVISTSREGFASIVVEFERGSDMQAALVDVETAVGQITTLPEDSDEPKLQRIVRYDTIARVLLSGSLEESELKPLAKDLRDDLIRRGIDRVSFTGMRDEEIQVQVRPEVLRELDLSVEDISQRIRQSSQDLPSGDTQAGMRKQIRSVGLVEDAAGVGLIEIVSRDTGEKVLLRDIATVVDSFDDNGNTTWLQGERGIELHVQRGTSADALKTAALLREAVEAIRPTLPDGVTLTVYDEAAALIEGRIALLVNNGIGGLVIVLLVLVIFLNIKVAFWVAVGIPTALMGAMGIMLLTGQSINMISLFGMILVLGIVVDDAIVVGEHAEMQRSRGLSGADAAIRGAQRMAAPVLASILTTIAAFLPMFVVGDIIGTIIRAIPLVVVAALLCSLIECFLVLPGHMRHALSANASKESALRTKFNRAFNNFRDGSFRRLIEVAIRRRYSTISFAIALLILAIGLIMGGRVGFTFFPTPEVDVLFANVKMVAGHDRDDVQAILRRVEAAAYAAEGEISPDDALIHVTVARVGQHLGSDGPAGQNQGASYGSVYLELKASELREVRTATFVDAWRENIPKIAGLESLSITPAQAGPPGREIDIRLFGGDPAVLKAASAEVQALAKTFPGVSEIEDNLPYGREEVVLGLSPRGLAMGFTTETVGRQVRNAFEGSVAKRFARGDEEVEIIVQLDKEVLASTILEDLYIRGPTGAQVPLGEVVTLTSKHGFSIIRRQDGFREVAITGEVDENVTSNGIVLAEIKDRTDAMAKKHGINIRFAGKAEEQAKTFGDMKIGAMTGLALIYIILAWVFGSYWLPLAVMSIIPFGMIGVGFGHYLMNYDLTFLSMVGMLGLSGILVNDSIVLISTIDRRIQDGLALHDAIVRGTCERFRAVLLTSLTTVGGLTPLMFETSVQAQFLIPMAITIVFGLALATFLVLLVVPSLVAIGADIRHGASGGMRLAKQLRRSAQAQELPVDYEERPAE
jgi:multidrug efflux pump subunit AcrB